MKTLKYDAAEAKVVAKLNQLLLIRRQYITTVTAKDDLTRAGTRAFGALEAAIRGSVKLTRRKTKKMRGRD